MVKSTFKSCCWSVTINNPTDADDECIAQARQRNWKVEGQKEKGENGTEHYQLMVLSNQQRFSTIKKAFPRAHIEPAKNKEALLKYVNKEETRVDNLPETQDLYPSLQKLYDMFQISIKSQFIGTEGDPRILALWDGERWLSEFDTYVKRAIIDGYVVESMAVNPQIRSTISKYGYALYFRSLHRQDKKTPQNIISTENIVNDEPSEDDKASSTQGETQGDICPEDDDTNSESDSRESDF